MTAPLARCTHRGKEACMRVEKARLLELLHTENAQIEGALPAYQRQATALQAALGDTSLNGKSYDTLRERIQKTHAPHAKAQLASLQALADGNRRNADAVSALPETSPGVADTDEAQQRIDELERMNAKLQGQLEAAQGTDAENVIASPCQRTMSANASMIATLHDAIAQIEAYAAASAGFYQDAQDEVEGLPQMSVGAHDMTAKRSEMLVDDAYVEQRLGISKQDFVKMQMEQYGFDEETAETMWEIYKALYRKYPKASQEQIDWMWLRIMSQPDYDGTKWNLTSGDLSDWVDPNYTGDDFVTKWLGINAQTWARLKFAIAAQHAISGAGDSKNLDKKALERLRQLHREAFGDGSNDAAFKFYMEKANSLYGDKANGGHAHADFSHQCVTAAAMYTDFSWLDFGFSGFGDERKAYAGWKGDSVLANYNEGGSTGNTSLGSDDYKADLDADSISRRARGRGISYQQAAKEYYDDIASGATNRADEFTGNHGGYDSVVSQIFNTLTYPNDPAAMGRGVILSGDLPYFDDNPPNSEKKVEIIGRDPRLKDTKNFLDALRNHQNEMSRETQ